MNRSTTRNEFLETEVQLLNRISDVAKITSLSKTTIYELINCGKLEAVKVGRSTRITSGALQRFLESLETSQPYKGGN